MAADVELSVVVPVYNDQECLEELVRQLVPVLEGLAERFEIVFTEDGGRDDSWRTICELAQRDPRVRGQRLSRNFGQHFAITAGLEAARGARVVVMDCDLQERPEEIVRLWQKMDEGHDIVFARRLRRKDGLFKRATASLFYFVINYLSGQDTDGSVGTLSMLRRPVVDAFLRIHDAHRHYLYVLRLVGFRQAYIDVEHSERFAGESSYTLPRLINHALDGITSQSTRLLQLSSLGGLLFVLVAAGQVIWLFYKRLVLNEGIEGWSSLMASIWFVGGVILFCMGIFGLYLGKMFEQTKRRPLYVVAERTDESA